MDRAAKEVTRQAIASDAELRNYLGVHVEVMQAVAGRPPRAGEIATARALWEARERAHGGPKGRLPTVSAWTAAGKTKAALALMVHLARQGKAATLALPEIDLIEEQYRDLIKVVPAEWVAMQSSLHWSNAREELKRDYGALGITPSKACGERDHRSARILLCTHDAWLAELRGNSKTKRWVYNWAKGVRDLVVVDEEPKHTAVYSFSPSDVTRLRELLGTTVLRDEVRDLGFTDIHPAAVALDAIRTRMEEFTDKSVTQGLVQPVKALVTADELERLENITTPELMRRILRVASVSEGEMNEARTQYEMVLKGLKAAAAGRIFFSKGGADGTHGASFFAYDWGVKIPPRTICLDGTVELDTIRAVTVDVIQPKGTSPSYAGSELHLVDLPKAVQDATPRAGKMLRREVLERQLWGWLRQFILTNTRMSDRVLVYWKKALHYHDFEGTRDAHHPLWEGREVHFTSFGADKGTNRYKHCNAYIQLGHLYLPRGVYVARLGAASGETLSETYLKRLAKEATKDPRLEQVKISHIIVRAKQDAARILREFNENGVCRPSKLFFISSETWKLAAWADRLFPGATLFQHRQPSDSTEPGAPTKRPTASERLVRYLRETEAKEISSAKLAADTGIPIRNLPRTLETRRVEVALQARGWRKAPVLPLICKVAVAAFVAS